MHFVNVWFAVDSVLSAEGYTGCGLCSVRDILLQVLNTSFTGLVLNSSGVLNTSFTGIE